MENKKRIGIYIERKNKNENATWNNSWWKNKINKNRKGL